MPTAALWAATNQVGQGYPPWFGVPPSVPSGSGGGFSTAFPDQDMQVRILAYLGADPTASSSTWPAPVDLTLRLLDEPMRITMARGQNQKTLQSGSCTLVLDNSDGALTPLLTSSAYYPGWDLGVPISVDLSGLPPNPAAVYPRFRGYAAEITPMILSNVGTTTKTSVVRLTVGGIVRRLSQGAVAKSAMRRSLSYGNGDPPKAYWPLEDGDGTTQFGSGIAGGSPAAVTTATFASDSSLAGSAPLPVFTAATSITGTISGTFSGGWRMACYVKFPAALSARTTIMQVLSTGGSAQRWVLEADATTIYVTAYDSAGTTIHSSSGTGGYTDLFSNNWVFLLFYVDNSGPLFGESPFPIASTSATGQSTSSGTPVGGSATSFTIPASSILTGMSIGHIAFYSTASGIPGTPTGANSMAYGYAGEIASLRISRNCREESVSYNTIGSGTAVACGPQPIADIMAVLRDSETVDHGILGEDLTTWGILYRPSGARADINAPNLTIDLTTYDTSENALDRVLVPSRNDQRIRNEWTITRPDGTTVTAKDSTNQALRGRYADSETVNVYLDSGAMDEAQWRVWEGGRDLLRYPDVNLDLAANTDILPIWLAVQLGDRFDRIHHPSPPHPIEDASFMLEGYVETLGRRVWNAQLVLEPYAPWQVGILSDTSGDGSPDLGRLAGDSKAAIRADISSSATSIAFDPLVYRWTIDSDDFTPNLRVRLTNTTGVSGGGETVDVSSIATTAATVVAAGAMSSADNAPVSAAMYAGATADDWIVLVGRIRSASTGTISPPDGYTRIAIPGTDTTTPTQIWVKKHSGTESDPTVTPFGGAAGDTVSAFTFGLRSMPIATTDLNDAVVESSFLSNASAQDILVPGLSVYKDGAPIDGCVVVLIGGKDDDWTSVATISGMTELVDSSTTTGNDQGLVLDYVIQTTSTPVAHSTFTVTGGATAVSEGIAIAFAGGYQTMTVATRSVNGVVKAHSARTKVEVENAIVEML